MSKTSETQNNPLREGLVTRTVPQACSLVIFGATGDLTMRKLIPALYNIAADGELPPSLTVVGFARRPKTMNNSARNRKKTLASSLAKAFVTKFGNRSLSPF